MACSKGLLTRGSTSRIVLAFVLAAGTAASPASAQTDASSDTDARGHFERGRAAYEAGDFEAAVRSFRRAYLLSPRYPLLYNIGQAELRAGHDGLALEAFEAFLRQAPAGDPRRGEVEERARMLRSLGVSAASQAEFQAAQRRATEEHPSESSSSTSDSSPTPPRSPTSPTGTGVASGSDAPDSVATGAGPSVESSAAASDGGAGVAPWIVAGAGGVALIAGAVLMGAGAAEAGAVTGAADGARWTELEGRASSARTMWGVGLALLGVGGAAAAAGVAWAIVEGGSEDAGQPTATTRITPTGLVVDGRF